MMKVLRWYDAARSFIMRCCCCVYAASELDERTAYFAALGYCIWLAKIMLHNMSYTVHILYIITTCDDVVVGDDHHDKGAGRSGRRRVPIHNSAAVSRRVARRVLQIKCPV